MSMVGGMLYGMRWLLSAQHPAAYMASTAVSGGISSANYGMQSGLSSSGIPGMDFGSLLQSSIANFAQYQNTLAQYQAAFRGNLGTMGKDFRSTIENMQGEMGKIGYTKQNLVEYMDAIGRATGRTSDNLVQLTKNTLAFSRAYGVSDRALAATAQTFGRVGAVAEPAQLGSRLINSGVNPLLLNEMLPALSNLVAGQMDRGGGAQAANGAASLAVAINRMGEALGPQRGGPYIGAGAVRLAGQIDAGFASGSAMAMISNPMRRGESWADYRARLENPKEGALDNAITRARGMGPNAGAIMLVKSFGMSYTDALNLIRTGTRVTPLSEASSTESILADAIKYTTEPQSVGAMANSTMQGTGGLGELMFGKTANIAKHDRYGVYRNFTPTGVLSTFLGPFLTAWMLGGVGDNTRGSDTGNLDKLFGDFNKAHGTDVSLEGVFEPAAGPTRVGGLKSLKTRSDTTDLIRTLGNMGIQFTDSDKNGSQKLSGSIELINKTSGALDSLSESLAKVAVDSLSAAKRLGATDTTSVRNGRKTPPKGP